MPVQVKELTKRTRKEFRLSREEFTKFIGLLGTRGACLSETMGPLWQNIYYSPMNRPYVNTRFDYREVLQKIK